MQPQRTTWNDDRLDALASDLTAFRREVDRRFDKVDERFDKVDERFDKVDERFERLEEKFDERFEAMAVRFEKRFDRLTFGLLYVMASLLVAVVGLIAAYHG
jgi:tetrahydromethanopterin S-methyltransferase subunit G